jgi:predicted DCC family thiol-disulfide oxidoreductase YuxK
MEGVLIYDGDCGICNQSADWARAHLPSGTEIVPWQSLPDLSALGLTVADVESAAWWVGDDGTLRRGERAVAQTLRAAGGRWRLLGAVVDARPVRPVARAAYGWVARNRHRLSRDGACSTH